MTLRFTQRQLNLFKSCKPGTIILWEKNVVLLFEDICPTPWINGADSEVVDFEGYCIKDAENSTYHEIFEVYILPFDSFEILVE